MWKRLLRLVHPDHTGDDGSLFIWCRELQAHVAGDRVEEMPREARREPPRHHGSPSQTERIPYEAAIEEAASFSELTARALALAQRVGEPYAGVLRLLEDCVEAPLSETVLYRQQQRGCSYKQLAAIAYRVGMSYSERIAWYRLCESIPSR